MPSAKPRKPKTIAAVRPNVGVTERYRQRLQRLARMMHASVDYWVRQTYKSNEPIVAQDEFPAAKLRRLIRQLAKRWQVVFDDEAPALAAYLAKGSCKATDTQLKAALRKAGISVKFVMSKAQKDIIEATIAQNVSLIRSIPQQYFKDIEGAVMRSVQTGRDLSSLTDELQKTYGVTYRRARTIARSQNNMATSALERARQQELGITEAVWLHSAGGREPRKTHLAMSGKPYEIAKGMYDSEVSRNVWPGELPNCRCVSKSIIPGFS